LGSRDCSDVRRVTDARHPEGTFILKITDSPGRENVDVEFRILTRLRHPALPRAFEKGVLSDSRSFVLLSDFEGERFPCLAEWPSGEVLRGAVLQLLRVLRFLHGHGVYHADLKPENVLVQMGSGTASLCLIDFGHARTRDTRMDLRGTPEFWAPEIAAGKGVSEQTDLFALGALLFECAHGEAAFRGDALSDVLMRQRRLDLPTVTGGEIPDWLTATIDACLQGRAADRPASATSLLKAVGGGAECCCAVETPETLDAWLKAIPLGECAKNRAWSVERYIGADAGWRSRWSRAKYADLADEHRRAFVLDGLGDALTLKDDLRFLSRPDLDEASSEMDGADDRGGLPEDCVALLLWDEYEYVDRIGLKHAIDGLAMRIGEGRSAGAVVICGGETEEQWAIGRQCAPEGRDGVESYVREQLRVAGLGSIEVTDLHRRSGGVKSLVDVELRWWLECGRLVPTDCNGWSVGRASKVLEAAPDEAILGLEDLGRGERLALVCVYLWGGPIHVGIVEAAIGGSEGGGAERLKARGLLSIEGSRAYLPWSGLRREIGEKLVRPLSSKAHALLARRAEQGTWRQCLHGFLSEESDWGEDRLLQAAAEEVRRGELHHGAEMYRALLTRVGSTPESAALARTALAAILDQAGQSEAVVAVLEENGPQCQGDGVRLARALRLVGEREKALEVCANWRWGDAAGEILIEEARALCELGETDRARSILENLRKAGRERDRASEGAVLKALGVALAQGGDVTGAREVLDAACDLAKASGHAPLEAGCQMNLGNTAIAENASSALGHFEAAASIYTKLGDVRGRALAEYNRGRALKLMGRLDDADRAFGECASFAERIGLRQAKIWSRLAQANVLLERGIAKEAEKRYRDLLREHDEDARTGSLYGLAVLRGDRHEWDTSLRIVSRACRSSRREAVARPLLLRGMMQHLVGEHRKCREDVLRAMRGSKALRGTGWLLLACTDTVDSTGGRRRLRLGRAMSLASSSESRWLKVAATLMLAERDLTPHLQDMIQEARALVDELGSAIPTGPEAALLSLALAKLGRWQLGEGGIGLGAWSISIWLECLVASVQACKLRAGQSQAIEARQAAVREIACWYAATRSRWARRRLRRNSAVVWLMRYTDAPGLRRGSSQSAALLASRARLASEPYTSRTEQGLRTVLEISRAMTGTLDLDALLEAICDSVIALCSAERAFVIRIDEHSSELEVVVARDSDGRAIEDPLMEVSRTIIEGVLVDRQASLHQDALRESGLDDRPSIQSLELRSIVCVPLIDREECYGVLYAENRSRVGLFDSVTLEMVSIFGNQAAAAITTSRMVGELSRRERIRVLGEMAGGVAHDFNNLLTAILARAQLLQHQVDDVSVQRELGVIEKAAVDGAQIVRRIQDFTRVRRDRQSERVEMCGVVRDAVEFTRARWSKGTGLGVAVDVKCGLEEAWVEGSGFELREACTNVIVNAIEAMDEGGSLNIEISGCGGEVECTFRDTGSGIPANVLERVFDPFFTTKGERGSGLGLSLVFGIVTRHGGRVEVESKAGNGTCVKIRLPEASAKLVASEARKDQVSLRGVRVLVIDDEPAVGSVVGRILTRAGAEVQIAGSGAEGINLCQGQLFDCILTDLGMPEMSGYEVAERIREVGGAAAVLIMTGWGVSVDRGDLGERGIDGVVLKPFGVEDLAARVWQCVERRRATEEPAAERP
jgi:signal transduction histidine kinase/CheY-like chemotaxis protein/tetratricopeptide (TPR) repeat protein